MACARMYQPNQKSPAPWPLVPQCFFQSCIMFPRWNTGEVKIDYFFAEILPTGKLT